MIRLRPQPTGSGDSNGSGNSNSNNGNGHFHHNRHHSARTTAIGSSRNTDASGAAVDTTRDQYQSYPNDDIQSSKLVLLSNTGPTVVTPAAATLPPLLKNNTNQQRRRRRSTNCRIIQSSFESLVQVICGRYENQSRQRRRRDSPNNKYRYITNKYLQQQPFVQKGLFRGGVVVVVMILLVLILLLLNAQSNNNDQQSWSVSSLYLRSTTTHNKKNDTMTNIDHKNNNHRLPMAKSFDMKEYLQRPENMLQFIDYQYYTIRINTWERPEQLQLSLHHHLTCASVLQIQIIWCLDQTTSIPDWLLELEQVTPPIVVQNSSYPRIVIERHVVNSLNERFHPLSIVPTAAVLSIDDDVLRPCLALDYTFYNNWIRNPHRQVGFDARSHEIVRDDHHHSQPHHHHHHHHHHHDEKHSHHNHHPAVTTTTTAREEEETEIESDTAFVAPQWKYSYMSVTERTNLYSLTLTRYSFFHRYYLTLYMMSSSNEMSQIRTSIDTNFNCEDIAMSMLISSSSLSSSVNSSSSNSSTSRWKPHYQVPLLANVWAVKSQIKLYVEKKISGTSDHKHIRDECVHNFSQMLHLQSPPPPQSSSMVLSDPDDSIPIFHTVPLHLGTSFDYGDIPDNWNDINVPPVQQLSTSVQHAISTVQRWKNTEDQQIWMNEWKELHEIAVQPIFNAGYIEKTIPWKRRFHK